MQLLLQGWCPVLERYAIFSVIGAPVSAQGRRVGETRHPIGREVD